MQNRVIARISIAFFLILSVVACKVKGQSELYGTYLADYDVAKEKLTLNKNGTFIQEVTLKANLKIVTTEGTWIYDSKSGYVGFRDNFMSVLNGFQKLNPAYFQKLGSASLPVDKYFGIVMLGSAEGVLYKKASSEQKVKGVERVE